MGTQRVPSAPVTGIFGNACWNRRIPTMALNLYGRHGSHCPGGRRLHKMTYEADELRRGWRKCSCPIYASGTRGGRFRRRNTAKAKPVESPIVAAVAADASPPRISITDAIRPYLAVREGAGIAPATVRKQWTFTKKLRSFADERGYSQSPWLCRSLRAPNSTRSVESLGSSMRSIRQPTVTAGASATPSNGPACPPSR
jgi:hypothetical protein